MKRIEELMNGFMDGTLTPSEADELDRMLEADAEARGTCAAIMRLEAALRGLAPSADVCAAVMDRIRREGIAAQAGGVAPARENCPPAECLPHGEEASARRAMSPWPRMVMCTSTITR